MKADSPAATSGGNARLSGWTGSFIARDVTASADVVVLQGAFEVFLGNQRTNRRVELRKGTVERPVSDMAADAGIARRHGITLGGVGGEQVEHVALLVLAPDRVHEVDLVVGELRLRESALV